MGRSDDREKLVRGAYSSSKERNAQERFPNQAVDHVDIDTQKQTATTVPSFSCP
jgi:hypothetical protein